MRPIFTFALALFLLTACSNTPAPNTPQVTVISQVTVTSLPPTQTPAPTFTPAPHIEMLPLPDNPHDIPAISADELQKLYPGGMPEIIAAYNKLALEEASKTPWTGARATGFFLKPDSYNNMVLLMKLDKKAVTAKDVPVEYWTSIIDKGNGKISGGELLFHDIVPELEQRWKKTKDVLLVNGVIHTNKGVLVFTGFTDKNFVFGDKSVKSTFSVMQEAFGVNRERTTMPGFNVGSFGDYFNAALTKLVQKQMVNFKFPDGKVKETTLELAWAKIGEAFREAKTEEDFQKLQMMLNQVPLPLVGTVTDSFK